MKWASNYNKKKFYNIKMKKIIYKSGGFLS